MGVEILFPILGRCTAPMKSVNVDDMVSQFNRVFMFYLSLTFAVATTIRQMLGGAVIACDGFPPDRLAFAEDWCWCSGIYTIKEAYELTNTPSPYPGIIPEDMPACMQLELKSGGRVVCPDEKDVKPLTRIYQSWYPFVMFYFWLTAMLFFLPYKLYKLWGFDKVKAVVEMLQNPVEDGFEKRELIKRGSIWLFLQSSVIFDQSSLYAFFTVKHNLGIVALVVKVLNVASCLAIYLLTHKMFKFGSFMEYGLQWEGPTPLGNVRSLIQEKLFPKVAACELKRWGPTGIEEDQGMCMLTVNILNQYLFLIFWFCLLLTLVLNSLSLLLTLLKLMFPPLMLTHFLASASLDRHPALPLISEIYLTTGSSTRFILDIFASNVQPKLLAEILVQLYALLSDKMRRRKDAQTHRHTDRKNGEALDFLNKIGKQAAQCKRRGNGLELNLEMRPKRLLPEMPKTHEKAQIPVVCLNGEVLSLRSESDFYNDS